MDSVKQCIGKIDIVEFSEWQQQEVLSLTGEGNRDQHFCIGRYGAALAQIRIQSAPKEMRIEISTDTNAQHLEELSILVLKQFEVAGIDYSRDLSGWPSNR